jgi:hypothetical protein
MAPKGKMSNNKKKRRHIRSVIYVYLY